ncbi:MAG: SUMF1/EgtB/PvdO family nonheme iron enzyme, partial [Planctomycetota bacterium]|nr:SUMF1/EgtB/PvdO family nonheme iron enzyme [Planctomycetota bacterium]
MKIVASCSLCGHLFKIEDIFEGVDLPCPKCGESIVIKATVGVDDKGLPSFEPAIDVILDKVFSGKATDDDMAKLRAIGATIKEQKTGEPTTSVKKPAEEPVTKPVSPPQQTAAEKKPSEKMVPTKPSAEKQAPESASSKIPSTSVRPKTSPKIEPKTQPRIELKTDQKIEPKIEIREETRQTPKPPTTVPPKSTTRPHFRVRLDESGVIKPPTEMIKRPKYAEKILEEEKQEPAVSKREVGDQYEKQEVAGKKPLSKQILTKFKAIPLPKLNKKQALVAAAILALIVLISVVWTMLRAAAERQKLRDNALASVTDALSRRNYSQFISLAQEFLKNYPDDEEKSRLENLILKAEKELNAAREFASLKKRLEPPTLSLKELEELEIAFKTFLVQYKGTDIESEVAKTLEEIERKFTEKRESAYLSEIEQFIRDGKYGEALRMLELFRPTTQSHKEKKESLLRNLRDYEEKAKEILKRGRDAFSQDKFDEALELLNRVAVEYPYSSSASEAKSLLPTVTESKAKMEEVLYKERLEFGKRKLKAREWKEAKDAFEAALKLRPQDEELKKLYALAKEKESRYRNMVLIGEGWFEMGADDGAPDEAPKHKVYLKAYYICKYPVTNREYKEFIDANREHPVPYVDASWAKDYNWDIQTRTYPKGKDDHP